MSEANKEALHHTLIVLLFIAGFAVISMGTVYMASKLDTSNELACRDGKLFEVTHKGNITIYDPTFDECEEEK